MAKKWRAGTKNTATQHDGGNDDELCGLLTTSWSNSTGSHLHVSAMNSSGFSLIVLFLFLAVTMVDPVTTHNQRVKRCASLISQLESKEAGVPKARGRPPGSRRKKLHWQQLKKQQHEAERVAAQNKEREEAEARKSSLCSRRHDTSPTPK